MIDLAAIRTLMDELTAGPWIAEPAVRPGGRELNVFRVITAEPVGDFVIAEHVQRCDAPFLASAPEIVRDLIAEVERLRSLERNARRVRGLLARAQEELVLP